MKSKKKFEIIFDMLKLVKPLILVMATAVFFGVVGFLCAIFITVIPAMYLGQILISNLNFFPISFGHLVLLLFSFAILRGVFHYAEHFANHYIAFKLLALIRHKVFNKLRKLAPAKLEGKNKGDLISLITSDIELLEVFYAHTISPIAIAIVTGIILIVFLGNFSIWASIIAFFAFVWISIVIPLILGNDSKKTALSFRKDIGRLNSFILNAIDAVLDIVQFDRGQDILEKIDSQSVKLLENSKKLSEFEKKQQSFTNISVMLWVIIMLRVMIHLYLSGKIELYALIISTVTLMSSFGPFIAISNLTNNLNMTMAAAHRVLGLLKEDPIVSEVLNDEKLKDYQNITVDKISFKYDKQQIIDNWNLRFEKNKIYGILGKSGSGKSTLLKLIMRFWDVDSGSILIYSKNINQLDTKALRESISYQTQESFIFNDTIRNNLLLANESATQEDLELAAKKASIHQFIESLPLKYDTMLLENGKNLSLGQVQRIGLARCFLHKSDIVLLDEPTSNLDSLNEGIILKSIKEHFKDKTVILISHRKSTLSICDEIVQIEVDRQS